MATEIESEAETKAAALRALHVAGQPLVLFNAWDAGSTKAVTAAGARAIATGSWSVAAAHGFADGEALPWALAVANLARVVAATALPVSVDLESGYGATPDAVARAGREAWAVGAVGCNLEDSLPADGSLRAVDDQVARLVALRAVSPAPFVNARTDVFFQRPAAAHDAGMVDAALERGRRYADAGADGLFVPGIVDEALIARVVAGSALPVNIMVMPGVPPLARLAELGVARVSHGPGPYRLAMQALEAAARVALGG